MSRNVETVRQTLQRRREAILETTRRAVAELEGLRNAERDPEFEEGAQSEHAQYTLARLTDNQRREVSLIEAALARVSAGEYGVCVDCEQDIDPRRLAALPYALLCTECAQRRERSTSVTQPPPTL